MSRKEFDEWLYQNLDHLRSYTAWEVANLALACGFKMTDIAPDVSSWVQISKKKLELWKSPFREQWIDLWIYGRGHTWDE